MKRTFRVKTFMNGGSQAIRIPAEARFKGDEVLLTYDLETGVATVREIPEEPNLLRLLDKWSKLPPLPREVWEEFEANLAELRVQVSAEDALASARDI